MQLWYRAEFSTVCRWSSGTPRRSLKARLIIVCRSAGSVVHSRPERLMLIRSEGDSRSSISFRASRGPAVASASGPRAATAAPAVAGRPAATAEARIVPQHPLLVLHRNIPVLIQPVFQMPPRRNARIPVTTALRTVIRRPPISGPCISSAWIRRPRPRTTGLRPRTTAPQLRIRLVLPPALRLPARLPYWGCTCCRYSCLYSPSRRLPLCADAPPAAAAQTPSSPEHTKPSPPQPKPPCASFALCVPRSQLSPSAPDRNPSIPGLRP